MDDLVQWLGKQYDEDEEIAQAVHGPSDKQWWVAEDIKTRLCDDQIWMADASFIAAHGPARVLREIDAKRQILRALQNAEVALRNTEPGKESHELMRGSTNSLRATVRMLATAYADRPGYREEWRP
ncbi:DUF6221 family protein [Streptomyces sp. NPDC102406]|uniref:DUF6221 family protein n=1 Tax=Streptomyces sp. NPDC102406 TaxID=3366171 RepID=UPI0038019192